MPMHFDERTDYLVRPIFKSSDLPLFLCHHPSSDKSAKKLSDFVTTPEEMFQEFLMRPQRQVAEARAALRRVE
jgi:hypothetical protein